MDIYIIDENVGFLIQMTYKSNTPIESTRYGNISDLTNWDSIRTKLQLYGIE